MSLGSVTSRRSAPASLRDALLATIGTLCAAAGVEAVVYGLNHHALSDIPGRFSAWNLHPSLLPYQGRPIEYPVVVGYVAWVTAWFGHSAASFFVANSLLSAGLALVMTIVLFARGRPRIWRWAAGIPLALYAFHNWDLLAMVPAVIALLAFDEGMDRTSGALLAIGASAKIFPGVFLPPLVIVRWHRGDRRGATRLAGAFVLVTVLLNGPVAWRRWSSWTYPASFQGSRSATWGTLWFWLLRIPGAHALAGVSTGAAVDVLVVAALLGALGVVSVLAVSRGLDAVMVGAALVGAFMLANKVYSPNYDLWIVPFFVLIPISRRVWIGFSASVLGIFVVVYGHLHGLWSVAVVEALLLPLVVVRALAIIAVIVTALRGHAHPIASPEAMPAGSRRTGVGLARVTSTAGWSGAPAARNPRSSPFSGSFPDLCHLMALH